MLNLEKIKLYKNLFLKRQIFAFTIAEILITLGIIGVVAAITIPVIVKESQDLEYRSKLKKLYSALSQAQKSIMADNNGDFAGAFVSCKLIGPDCVVDLFKKKLSFTKECTNLGDCISQETKRLKGDLAKDYTGFVYFSTNGLILNDGASFVIYPDSGYNCDVIRAEYNNGCGWITADVNGPFKGPNVLGKDVYIFSIFSDVIRPMLPSFNSAGGDDCEVGFNFGYSCSAKYLYE